jgi:GNAT superfamily N-acetyltransferase
LLKVEISIRQIKLPVSGMDALLGEALTEGYDFVETLTKDWASGQNRFDGPGELLLGCFDGDSLIGVGGLNVDPFEGSPRVGRIRRVYVRCAWRNRGVGRALVTALVYESRKHFESVRLRAENADAARLYESMGFVPMNSPDATHILHSGLDCKSDLSAP